MNFWFIVPVAILAAMFTGFTLALPVLRMRGDYLAIATLGFGEIIRLLALSDWLKPYIGGAQGILFIPKPDLPGLAEIFPAMVDRFPGLIEYAGGKGLLAGLTNLILYGEFGGPQELYYIIFLGATVVFFVAVRLNNSRTGRQWMAMREDEDAASAMGINTTTAKVLAFTVSAASGGLAGAIFASKVGTIFPNSFNLLVSINVLSLIIIGGMGSIPGIIVGSLALIGLPELLREFSEFRLLLYGALLVIMMLVKPEGLWPSPVIRREMAAEGGEAPPPEAGAMETSSPMQLGAAD
jgi:branched-chain amino acid transport system permease protein